MPITSQNAPVINSQQFRADLPEFSDKNKYPDSSINYWLAVATILLNADRFASILILAVEQYVAHNLVIETQAQDAALAGGWPGVSKGPISGEGAGGVSVNYTADALELEAGHWNLTVYGTRFIRMARMAGAGPIQVGGGCLGIAGTVPGASLTKGPAWGGPNTKPGWFGS